MQIEILGIIINEDTFKHIIIPFFLSAITVYQMFLVWNFHKYSWIIWIVDQMMWLVFIIYTQQYGFLPLNIANWIVYARNHFKWKKENIIK